MSKTFSRLVPVLRVPRKYKHFYSNFLPGNITRLVLRSRLNLSELVANKLFAIVFQLNYVMSEEFAKPVVVDNTDDSGVKKKRVKLISIRRLVKGDPYSSPKSNGTINLFYTSLYSFINSVFIPRLHGEALQVHRQEA